MIVADRGELRQARLRAQIELNKDEKYLDLLKRTVHNEEWIRNNLWPPEVRATAEAIDIADRYLFQDRAVKFDRPWNVTDILVLSPQPKKMTSDMYAMEVDLSFTAPAIMVNAAHGSIPSSVGVSVSQAIRYREPGLDAGDEMARPGRFWPAGPAIEQLPWLDELRPFCRKRSL